jgi:hypothetical protein
MARLHAKGRHIPSCIDEEQLGDTVTIQIGEFLERPGRNELRLVVADLVDLGRIAAPAIAAAGTLNDDLFDAVAVNVGRIQSRQLALGRKREDELGPFKDCL